MILYSKRQEGERTRRPLDLGASAPYHKSEWLQSGTDETFSPTIFLVEQPPGSVLPTHFHRQNEFQVVVRGSGSLGRHPLGGFSVHYAGAYTGYGPIIAGPEGLAYFTIRPVFDVGALTVDQAKPLMKRGPKRQLHAAALDQGDLKTPLTAESDERRDLIAPEQDGVHVELLRLRPGDNVRTSAAGASWCGFHLVCRGSVAHGDQRLHEWETLFCTADEAPLALIAGDEGAVVISMWCPHTADAYAPATSVPIT